MKDFLGKTVIVNDHVVLLQDNPTVATIMTITPKMIRVKWGDGKKQNKYVYSHQLIKVDTTDLTWYYLNKI